MMLTECCKVAQQFGWDLEGQACSRCPKCGRSYPVLVEIPETPKQVFDRKCEEYGGNAPDLLSSRNDVVEIVSHGKGFIKSWNEALEAVRSAWEKDDTTVGMGEPDTILMRILEELKK